MYSTWYIREPKNIRKIMKRLGAAEKSRYISLIRDFSKTDDPTSLGVQEKFTGVKIWVARLNDSYRVKYLVDHKNKIITILSIGDHKEVKSKE